MSEERAFVLIVEDEKAHGEAIAEGLAREGHACHIVQDGKEALEDPRRQTQIDYPRGDVQPPQ